MSDQETLATWQAQADAAAKGFSEKNLSEEFELPLGDAVVKEEANGTNSLDEEYIKYLDTGAYLKDGFLKHAARAE